VDIAAEVRRAYRDILGREPEAGMVEQYTRWFEDGTLTSVTHMRQNIRAAPEAEGARNRFINEAYKEVLGRDADAAGAAHWAQLLRDGTYDNVDQLKQALGLSDEAKQRGTSDQRSARTVITEQLREWGLEGLGDWAWQQIRDGNGEQLPMLIRQTAEYKTRFSGLEARRSSGKNVMSEAQYLQMENDYRSIMRSYGIPSGVFDTQTYLGGLIAGDLSPNELNDRLRIYQDAAYNAPAELRASLSRLYNIDPGALTAYYIDPARALPVLEAQYAAAGAASAAQRAGFATFGASTAERLAQLGATANDTQAFDQLNQSRELFTDLGFQERGGPNLSDDQAAIATFGGDAEGADAMRKRGQRRAAEFQGGGGFAQSNRGATGLGSASD
jgi:hypothetical protein